MQSNSSGSIRQRNGTFLAPIAFALVLSASTAAATTIMWWWSTTSSRNSGNNDSKQNSNAPKGDGATQSNHGAKDDSLRSLEGDKRRNETATAIAEQRKSEEDIDIRNFDVAKDLPEFTIELDESDNDMF